MSLPTPYGTSNKETAPLLKGIPPPRTLNQGEYICYRIFVDWRIAYEGPELPLIGFPETIVFIYARHRDRIRCFFSLRSWRRGVCDVVWQSIALPMFPLVKSGRVKVVIPGIHPGSGSKQAVPAEMRNARRRVQTFRNGRLPHTKNFSKSSLPRPSSESSSTSDIDAVEGNNGGYFFSSTPSSYISHTRSWTGTRTPNFGKLKKSQLPVNPHTVVIRNTVDSIGAFLNFIPSTGIYFNRFRRFSSQYGNPPGIVAHLSSAEFDSLRRLIERANGGITSNIAQDFAQFGQTTKLIADTAKRLVKAGVALKKGNIPGAVQALWSGHTPRFHGKGPSFSKSFANNWLELQYGWKPLIQDVRDSMEALKRLNNASSPSVLRVTSSATKESESSIPIMSGGSPATKIGEHKLVIRTRCHFSLRFKIDDKLKVFLNQTGFTNPINLLWEILPFSFVADWFIPIGPYLETLSSFDGLSFLDGSKTLFTRGTELSGVDGSWTASGQNFEDHGRFRRQTILLDRVKLTAFPSAKIPSVVKNGLKSVTHAANAVALLRAFFR